jgi:methylglutaconyl-CoA hydratase
MSSQNPPKSELISLSIDGSVVRIHLAREAKYNALNVQMISELIDILQWTAEHSVGRTGNITDADGNLNFRILVLMGNGKHFCAGADINMMRDAGAKSSEENRTDSARLDRLFNSLWSHPCFTIGVVQGVALGGGAGLIACMDHVIADPSTKIALSEGKLGILPAVIGPYVYRRIGSANFRRLSMQASRINTTEALRIGMIEQVIEGADVQQIALDSLVSEVLTTGPMSVTASKELTLGFDRWVGSDEELRQWTLDFTSKMRGCEEGQEGMSSFLQSRKPNWQPKE